MDRRVHETIKIMKTNRHVSVQYLARLVRLSPWHFTHLFKEETSKSPMQYMKDLRMEHAEELLAKTLLTVKEVVSAVGLTDRTHFSREFKILHGVTPREFIGKRRTYREALGPTRHSKYGH